MKKQKRFSLNGKFEVFVPSISFILVLLAFSAILLPEFSESSFAETTGTGQSAVTLTLSPTNTHRSDYYIDFGRQTEEGSFGVVGINANVVTANEHGYSLYLRSKMPAARMIHENKDFSSKFYIDTVTGSNIVTNITGDGFAEMNRYGWSTDWNPNTGAGTFNPMQTTDMRIKLTGAPSEGSGDDTKIYIGAKINDQVVHGIYTGTLSFTAIANPDRILGNYILHYDLNGGESRGLDFSDQTITVDALTPSANFTLNANIPIHPSGYTFLGWSTDSKAKEATFKHSGADSLTPSVFTPSALETTLYAIWSIPDTPEQYTYRLNYNCNGGSNCPSNTSKTTESKNDSIPIDTTKIPTREGFKFKGYSETSGATTPSYTFSDGTFSPANVGFTFTNKTKTLYAVWKEETTFDDAFADAGKTKITASDGQQYYKMQDMTGEICANVTSAADATAEGTQMSTLVDSRDGKTYTVSKLLDGKCWMTKNLALGGSEPITLTSADSDVTSDFILPASFTNWSTSDINSKGIYIDTNNSGTGKDEGFYNWYTATAGTGNSSTAAGESATSSICPKGWRLPGGDYTTAVEEYNTGNYTKNSLLGTDFYKMLNPYINNDSLLADWDDGSFWYWADEDMTLLPDAVTNGAPSLSFAGNFLPWHQEVDYQGVIGSWWSSVALNEDGAFFAGAISYGSVSPVSVFDRMRAYSVRCLADSSALASSNNTNPLGVTTSETDNGTAALIAAGVGTAVAASSFLVLFLAKRKKDEEEELNVED